MQIVGILLCAGSANRMGFDKITTPLCGKSPVQRSAEALISGGVTELVLTASAQTRAFLETLTFSVPHKIVAGGDTRQASVHNALEAATGDIAVIHDAARAMVTPDIVRRCVESALNHGSGIAAAKATDTVLRQTEVGVAVVPRDEVYLMQTPQCFAYDAILSAYRTVPKVVTDDCSLYIAAGHTPVFVESPQDNFKLTTPKDWARAERMLTRYGTGYDTHRLVAGRKLILGGVDIPYEKGLLGHSDADVLLHAVMDALLGAAALGDIGKLFPDSDARYLGADSLALLQQVRAAIEEKGYLPVNIDATVIAQAPKLAPYKAEMEQNIAHALRLPVESVSVKATTTEGCNDEGKGVCISAMAIAAVR